MDFRGFSSKIKDVLKEGSLVRNNFNNGRAYGYDLAILFARIWFLKSEIFVQRSSTPITTSLKDFINGLHEGSRFLQNSFSSTQLKPQKREYQILKLVEQIPGEVEALFQSSQSEDSVGNSRVRDLLYKLLVQFMLFKAEWLLFELLNNEITNLKNQIGTVREGLVFLIKSDINHPREDTRDEKLILADIEVLATGVISLCNSSPAHDRVTEEAVKNMEFQLFDLLAKVQPLKAKLKELYFQIPRSTFPKTPGLRTINILLQKFNHLHSQAHDSLSCVTYQIEDIRRDLEFIILEYSHIFAEQTVNQECINIRTRLVEAVHQVQHVIESMEIVCDPSSEHLLWLYHLSSEIGYVKDQLPLIDYYDYEINTSESDVALQTDSSRLRTQQIIVGFNHGIVVMADRLTTGTNRLDVVSITGMAGIGKTTLALNVFRNPRIEYFFHICVWYSVSQACRKRDLLLGILSRIMKVGDDMLAMTNEELHDQLHKHLSRKRYLIVMDDVWSAAAWDDIRNSFPDKSNGSRILMTSRLNYVVPNPHPFGGLSDEESWDLLKMKVFGENECPEELLKIGLQIAKNCKGLPIAIGVVAGLLARKDKYQWQEIAKIASSQIVNDQITQNMDIFERCYQHLPDQLKECFLYFGVFPKDRDILVRKLLWLWIAEGFIDNEQFRSLEEIAEEYLTILIENNLVIAARIGSNGKVKTCRVHSQVIKFCLLKAKNAKFSQLIYGSSHGIHNQPFNPSDFINVEQYRLSICGDPEHFIASRPSGPYVRSLLFFASNKLYAGCDSDVSFISNNFRLLKVLDLESVNVGNTLENGTELPVHLRYLAVGGDMNSLPSSLSKLQNLETLVVKGLMNNFFLPDAIWSLKKLRHIRVTNHCIFTLQNEKNGSNSMLDSLVSLSMPFFPFVKEMINTLRRLPNLRILECVFLEPRIGSMHASQFPELGSLCFLESLKLCYSGRPLHSVEWDLPSSLKKLTLWDFRLPWNQISAIGKLPNLEVLKLMSKAFVGSTWDMGEEEFIKLRYLKLDSLNIVHWYASDHPLRRLEQLVLRNCKRLVEVPSSFMNILTLQRIEVHQCGVSARELVGSTVEELWAMGNEDLIFNYS